LIPNPTVSLRVNAFVPAQRTIRLSLNDTFPGTPSSQLYPIRRVPASTGIFIQRSVIGLAPGFVSPTILQDTHHGAPTTSHSSPADEPSTPSPQYPGVYPPPPPPPPGPPQVRVFPVLHAVISL
jgi:hypothetical protein